MPLPDRDRRQDSPVNPAPGNRIEPRFPLASGNERLVEGEPLTGPPPAFQRSPLQEQRDEVMTPDPSPATISAPEKPEPDDARAAEPVEVARSSQSDPATPVRQAEAVSGDAHASMRSDSSESPDATTDALRDTIRRVMADTASFDVPPPPVERAQIEFTSVRRMETPYDAATVDVTR